MVFTNISLDGLHIISAYILNMFVWMDLNQTPYLYHLVYHKVQCLDPCSSLSTSMTSDVHLSDASMTIYADNIMFYQPICTHPDW